MSQLATPPAPAAVLLAAGKGTRMRSALPKVLHHIGGLPLIVHALRAVAAAGCERVVVVIGHGAEAVREEALRHAPPGIKVAFAVQEQQLGTGHAARVAEPALEGFDGDLFILPGDVPLIRGETLTGLLSAHRRDRAAVTVMSVRLPDAAHYGRIVRDEGGLFQRIVEARDASAEELAIREINTGAFVVKARRCFDLLRGLGRDNAQGEYYLTDLVDLARRGDEHVIAWLHPDASELMGVNDRAELADAEARLRRRINRAWMMAGVTLVDPETTWIAPEVVIGADSVLEPGVMLRGAARIGGRCHLGPGAIVESAEIGDDARIGAHAVVSGNVPPGAVIRPLTRWPQP